EYADITGRRFLEAGREMKERALPRARPAENRDEFAGLDAQVETSKRDCLDLSGAIDLEDVDALKCRPGTGFRRCLRFSIEARHLHRKLSIIKRYASTLSTPLGVPRSTTACLPAPGT